MPETLYKEKSVSQLIIKAVNQSRRFTFWLSFFLIIIMTAVSFMYIVLTFASVLGFVLASAMTLGSLFMALLTDYNTTLAKNDNIAIFNKKHLTPAEKNRQACIFLIIAIPCCLLSMSSVFIGNYASLTLLGQAMGAPLVFMVMGIVVGILNIVFISGYSAIQMSEMFERIKGIVKKDESIIPKVTAEFLILDSIRQKHQAAKPSLKSVVRDDSLGVRFYQKPKKIDPKIAQDTELNNGPKNQAELWWHR